MKKTEENYEFFIFFILPVIILVLGLFGNVLGMLLITTSKRLAQIGPVNTYHFLLLADCVFLVMLATDNYLVNGFSIGFSLLHDSTCKIYKYTAHVIASLSRFCLIYILIERYLAIKFPVESNCLRTKTTQLVYHITVTVIACIYYIPVLVYFKIQHQISSNNSTAVAAAAAASFCDPTPDKKLTMQLLTLVSKVAIPAVLILVFSIV